jgi:hypothetical protein
MKHLTSKLILLVFTGLIMLVSSCEYDYYVIPSPTPQVLSTDPVDGDTGIFLSKTITATFDAVMDRTSINGTTFTIKNGANTVAGTVAYSGTTATFIPTGYLLPNTTYTGTISKAVKSDAGSFLAGNYTWTFKTGTDTTGSSDTTHNDTTVVVVDSISFVQDIIPIFTTSCIACHKGSQAPDLRATKAYAALINGGYVVAKEPENSLLYTKCNTGGSMKKYTSTTDLKLIKRWILKGALND